MRTFARMTALWFLLCGLPGVGQQPRSGPHRNVIVFVADGLRHGSVNQKDTPALWQVRTQGVDFRNSYSVFPTFTTANASAIATGHALGDTGDFSNTIWVGHATYDTGNYGLAPGTPVPFIENDQAIGDLDDHFGGNYLGEETLLAMARAHGYHTAAFGKIGPTAIQDVSALAPVNGKAPPPSAAIIIDDATGTPAGVAIPPALLEQFRAAKLPPEAPQRTNGFALTSQYSNGNAGNLTRPGTLAANTVQQQWMADVATRVVLPWFEREQKPFALVYWSRDPDASQHNHGDSLNSLSPGINGDTSRAGIQNADHNLKQILDWLDAHPEIKRNTDVVVTSDHGFATIARRVVDGSGHPSSAESAKHAYLGADGRVDTEKGGLPNGFLAIDLAAALETKLWDPDRRGEKSSPLPFREVRLGSVGSSTGPMTGPSDWERPAFGNGLLGARIEKQDGSDATAIVAANGGSDLVYVPSGDAPTVQKIVTTLLGLDYVGAIFVDDKFQPVAGTLPLSAINLVGATKIPRPTIVVAFKTFYLNDADLQSAIQISDTSLQEGQGMHGGFGRDQTYNNMAALGPDFKKAYVDNAPFANSDIVPTLTQILGFDMKPNGKLVGRVAREALHGGKDAPAAQTRTLASPPASGKRTVLRYQELDGVRYLHSAVLQPEK
jgi:arylsulfatase A-like enzyme